jgi:2-polyprenyl-3-methyl-5-hydroxy-6-metoxy-1,4-benzoquinol methylase
MTSKIASWESQGNKHIDINAKQRPLPYHQIISDLAIQHSSDSDKILDIGCGIGQLCNEIKKKGAREIHAADAYQMCLDKTQRLTKIDKTYLLEEENFNISEVIKDEFSVVIMSHVLEHMLDPVQAINEVFKLVKPGGTLILAVPNPARPGVLLSNITKTHYVNRGHVVAWDMSHWRNFLENILKLEVLSYHHDFIQIKGCNRFPVIMKLGQALGKAVPWWCFSNIAVIQKP